MTQHMTLCDIMKETNDALKEKERNFPFIKERINYLICNSGRLNCKGKNSLNNLINKILDEWEEKEKPAIKTKRHKNSRKKILEDFA